MSWFRFLWNILAPALLVAACAPASSISQRSGFDREAAMGKASRLAYGNKASSGTTSENKSSYQVGDTFRGKASYYHNDFKGHKTANGEIYNPKELTCAHLTLPFGAVIRVTSLKSGKSVDIRVNDRGPFRKDRILDISGAAAKKIGLDIDGVAEVEVEVLSIL